MAQSRWPVSRTCVWGAGLAATSAVISGLAAYMTGLGAAPWESAGAPPSTAAGDVVAASIFPISGDLSAVVGVAPAGLSVLLVGAVSAAASAMGTPARRPHPGTDRAPLVIVGLGNEIASDDGVGIHVARALESEFDENQDVDVVALPWAGFALLDVLRGRKRAALIDCLTTGLHPPGSIVRLSADDFAGSVRLNSFHDISYPTVMDLGRSLGWEMPDDVAIWGIEAAVSGEFGEVLSPEAAGAARDVAEQVKQYMNTRAH